MSKPRLVCAADIRHLPDVCRTLDGAFDVRYVAPDPESLAEALADADAYYASLHVRLTAELIDRAAGLKAIATPSTGLDHIDVEHAERRGVAVLGLKNDRDVLDRIPATAELAWALTLSCARKLPAAFDAARRGRWVRDELRGHQLAYKTFGILGCGRLGTMVAQYAQAFRMTVIGNDTRDVVVAGADVRMVDLDTLLATSDVLSIHIHLTDANRGFINRQRLARMKSDAILINTSRGAIIDEDAVIEALDANRLGAYGTDVIHGEWRDDLDRHPLIAYARTHETVVITPHVGGVTFESQAMAYQHTADKLVAFFNERR